MRVVGAALALALLLPRAGAAQSASDAVGRWRLLLNGAAPVRGELRLQVSGEELSGSLVLESVDSGPLPLAGRVQPGGEIEFSVPLDSVTRFAGRVSQDHLEGVVLGAPPRHWAADRLPLNVEYYPALPRFTLTEVIAGRKDSVLRIPGRWYAAATATPVAGTIVRGYQEVARRAGLTALRPNELSGDGQLRVFGLYRRAELGAAVRGTLDSIRRAILVDSVRLRFDYWFRPRGEWLLDIHDAALLRARMTGASWETAARSLRAVGRVSADAPVAEAVPVALYRLLVLGRTDSTALAAEMRALQKADSVSGAAVIRLLNAYNSAAGWYLGALDFLLRQPWIPDSANGVGRSPADLVRAYWLAVDPAFVSRVDQMPLPSLSVRLFGYPQAVPRYGVPPGLFPALVRAENWSATQWLRRHGRPGLLLVLRQLPGDGSSLSFNAGQETFRVTTVGRQAQESLNGFLEPEDAVVLDPGYVPLFALATVVHEWQHLLLERLRAERAVPRGDKTSRAIVLPATDPYLAEGFAEWRTERALAPLVARYPLLGVGEAEKRARLALADSTDPHVLGYLLVRAAADGLRDSGSFTAALIRHGDDPMAVAADPAFARRWVRRRGPDWTHKSPSRRVLVPETTFTVEDGAADLVSTRIVAPNDH